MKHRPIRLLSTAVVLGLALAATVGTAHAACGDGTIDLGEDCDELTANGTPTSCCTVDCLFRSSSETCRDSAGPCDAAETCTGASGACPADVDEPDDTPCSDGLFCNGEETCQAGACEAGSDPCVTTCDEGTDECGSLCGVEPGASCLVDGGSVFLLKQSADPSRSKLKWKWGKGQPFLHEDLGSPQTTTTYELCIYDIVASTPQFLASLALPPNGLWVEKAPKGYSYKNKTLAADGIRKIKIKPGVIDKTKINFDAAGANLPVIAPASMTELFAVEPAITVELVSSDGECWSSDFAINDVKVNKDTQFKAVAK